MGEHPKYQEEAKAEKETKQLANEGNKNFDKSSIADRIDHNEELKKMGYSREKSKEPIREQVRGDMKVLLDSGKIKIDDIKKFFGGTKGVGSLSPENINGILNAGYNEKRFGDNGNRIKNGLINYWVQKIDGLEISQLKGDQLGKIPNRTEELEQLRSFGITNKSINNYISKLDEKSLSKINSLNKGEFIALLNSETRQIRIIEKKLGGKEKKLSIEQISNCVRASEFIDKIDGIISDLKSKNIDAEKYLPSDKEVDAELQTESGKKTLEKYGSPEIAREELKRRMFARNIRKANIYKEKPELFKEFDKVVVEHYEFTASIGIELGAEEKTFISTYYTSIEKEETNGSFKTADVMNTIKADPQMRNFLVNDDEKYNIQKDSFKDNVKDSEYIKSTYKNIIASDKKYEKYTKFEDYFDENMEIKSDKKSDKIVGELKNKLDGKINDKRDQTNTIIKNYALEKSFEILKKNMNIDIDVNKTENLIKNFTVGQNGIDVNENMELAIQGNYQGNKINLSYDLKTGEIFYDKFLSRQDNQNSKIIDVNGNSKQKIAGVKLPALGDFKDVDIKDALNKDEKNYENNLKNSLDAIANKYDTHNENFEKAMLENMVTQEMVHDIVPENLLPQLGKIDPKDKPNYHKLFSMILDTTTYCSVQELKDLRSTNKEISTQKNKIASKTNNTDYKIDPSLKEEEKNFEELFSTKKQVFDKDKLTKGIDNQYDSNLLFYSFFTKEMGNQKIIGLPELKDFTKQLYTQIGTEKDNKFNSDGSWKQYRDGIGKASYENSKFLITESQDKLVAENLIEKRNLENIA